MAAIEREARERGIPLRTMLTDYAEEGLVNECGAGCLNQRTLFTREDDPEMFIEGDGHWTAKGHRVVGEALASWLQSQPELGLQPSG
jgi:lysophospholipase L1-like esterase